MAKRRRDIEPLPQVDLSRKAIFRSLRAMLLGIRCGMGVPFIYRTHDLWFDKGRLCFRSKTGANQVLSINWFWSGHVESCHGERHSKMKPSSLAATFLCRSNHDEMTPQECPQTSWNRAYR